MAFRRLRVPPEQATGGKIVNVETVTSGAAFASYTKWRQDPRVGC